jgi:hypothetical protein
MEEALCYCRIKQETGITNLKLAEMFGKSLPYVASRLDLLLLSPEVRALIAEGNGLSRSNSLQIVIALVLARNISNHDLQIQIAKYIIAKKLSREDANLYILSQAKKAGTKRVSVRSDAVASSYEVLLNKVQKVLQSARGFDRILYADLEDIFAELGSGEIKKKAGEMGEKVQSTIDFLWNLLEDLKKIEARAAKGKRA